MLICIATSCSSTKGIKNIDDNVKKINVGMTQKKVVSILGNDYEITSSKDNTETLAYKTSSYGIYKLVFVDDKLKEWNKDQHSNHRDSDKTKKRRKYRK